MSKILNPSQAEAICEALDALNLVSATRGIELSFVGGTSAFNDSPMERITYAENAAGEVVVFVGPAMARTVRRENYPSQTAFASAYCMN